MVWLRLDHCWGRRVGHLPCSYSRPNARVGLAVNTLHTNHDGCVLRTRYSVQRDTHMRPQACKSLHTATPTSDLGPEAQPHVLSTTCALQTTDCCSQNPNPWGGLSLTCCTPRSTALLKPSPLSCTATATQTHRITRQQLQPLCPNTVKLSPAMSLRPHPHPAITSLMSYAAWHEKSLSIKAHHPSPG